MFGFISSIVAADLAAAINTAKTTSTEGATNSDLPSSTSGEASCPPLQPKPSTHATTETSMPPKPHHRPAAQSAPARSSSLTGTLAQLAHSAELNAEHLYRQHANWLVKKGNKVLWHLERASGLRYPAGQRPQNVLAKWQQQLEAHPFWELDTDFSVASGVLIKTNGVLIKTNTDIAKTILQSNSLQLWHWFADWGRVTHDNALWLKLEGAEHSQLKPWVLPSKSELLAFRKFKSNPANTGAAPYYDKADLLYHQGSWLCREGSVYLDYNNSTPHSGVGQVLAYHQPKQALAFWRALRQQNLRLAHRPSHTLLEIPDLATPADTAWAKLGFAALWAQMKAEGLSLVTDNAGVKDAPEVVLAVDDYTQAALLDLDYAPCRLPKLELAQLTDPNKGIWELWGEDAAALAQLGLRARNPLHEVRDEWVAIDFGTSSTVVAVGNRSGGKELLRIGVRDFNTASEAKHYENPTALEFLDFQAFMQLWNSQVYRPQLNWAWATAANEAQTKYRDDAKNPKTVGSVLLYLKRWALESERVVTRLVDSKHGFEYEIPPLAESTPVRGQLMQANPDAAFDPIELYAWFLGMVINWRQRGLYLKYALTFPVRYEQNTRNKILASFMRGLQRSLPHSLLTQSEILNRFEVMDVATEPMAYAVAVLQLLESEQNLAPSDAGLAYAVFDFGGGTTDFDFGLWRLPTLDEADEGAESVFERLGSGGDRYLGGENLLALLAYQVVQDNLSTVHENNLLFTKPLAEPAFAGGEAVLDQSSAAQANSAILAHALRDLLEQPETFKQGRLTLDLRSRQGVTVNTQLEFDTNKLQDLVAARVQRGVEGFLSDMRAAFAEVMPTQVHILLAGNASRGKWVREAFAIESETWQSKVRNLFGGEQAPVFVVHFAEGADNARPSDYPNCKTAVALGALDLRTNKRIFQKDRQKVHSQGDAPFLHFVGGMERKRLRPQLLPGCAYHEWHDLGIIIDGTFSLLSSPSPRARDGQMQKGDPELQIKEVPFHSAGRGYRCFARVVAPGKIELVAAASREALLQEHANLMPIKINLAEV